MTKQNLFKSIKINLALLAVATWTIEPLAQAKELQKRNQVVFVDEPSQEFTAEELKKVITENRLAKPQTFQEFYNAHRELFPEITQKGMAVLLNKYGKQQMPIIDVKTMKDATGKEIPVVNFSSGKDSFDVAFYGEENKFVKFDSVTLTKTDIVNFDLMFEKLFRQDMHIRKKITGGVDPLVITKKPNYFPPKTTANPVGTLPNLDQKTWSKWSQQERALYILNMRRLWVSARGVLDLSAHTQPSKQKGKSKTSSYDFLIKQMIDEAQATELVWQNDGRKYSSESQNSCIVAGYVAEYSQNGKGRVCEISSESITKYYSIGENKNLVVKTALEKCAKTKGSIACNPYIYGTPGGEPICINPKDKSKELSGDFNRATNAGGPCESKSKLGSIDQNDPFNATLPLNNTRYDNIDPKKLEEIAKKQQAQDSSLVENYLDGLVKLAGGKSISQASVLDDNMIGQIRNIKNAFDKDITQARSQCMAAAKSRNSSEHEKNFWGACDQLQRRYLMVEQYVAQKWQCTGGGTLITTQGSDPVNDHYLRCECPNKTYVNPGSQCVNVPETTQPVPPVPGKTETPVQDDKNADDNFNACNPNPCKGKNSKCEIITSDSGAEGYKCVAGQGGAGGEKQEPSFLEKIGNLIKASVPWLIGGAFIYGMVKLLSAKPKKRKAVGDCGTTTLCTTTCSNKYQAVVNGTCACPVCPGSQTITDSSTCTCGSSSSSASYICPDGLTAVTSLSDCPTTTNYVNCADGSAATSLLNCPSSKVSTKAGTSK